MKIEKITMENFKQFYGRQELVLSTDKKKKITIIQGSLAAGKTGVAAAVFWCLYGLTPDEIVHEGRVSQLKMEKGLISEYLRAGHSKRSAITSVEIVFSYNGKRYRVKRELIYKIRNKKIFCIKRAFSMSLITAKKEKPLPNAISLHDMLPQDAAVFFFTDIDWLFLRTGAARRRSYIRAALLRMLGDNYRRKLASVSAHCNRLFHTIVGNDIRYRRLKLRLKNDELQLLEKSGRRIDKGLPAETAAAVGFAFILALISHSKHESPLILDNPFIWLPKCWSSGAASMIADIKRQLLLLSMPGELSNVRDLLANRIGKRYLLKCDRQANGTRIRWAMPFG